MWPPESKAVNNWATVTEELQSYTEDDESLIVILDLGLDYQHRTAVDTGVQQARLLKSLRPRALFIAYTDYPDNAITRSYYDETFDGLIEKQKLGGYSSSEGQATYIRQIISGAVRRKAGSKPSYSLIDSVGLRLAAAAFGQQVFDLLVEEVAHGWGDVQIATLTSGHSGAFLLAISGTDESGAQRLIVKCAREKKLIESEADRVQKYLSELGPLAEVLAPVSRLHPLPQDLGYYYCQPKIPGEPLLDMLRNKPWDTGATAILDGILSLEKRCYDRSPSEPFGHIRPNEIFSLSPLDLGRANQSLKFLGDVGSCVEELEQWPAAYRLPYRLWQQCLWF